MWSEVKVTQSCPTLWPHGLFPWNSPGQNLEWVAVPFSRGSSHPRDQTQVSCIAGGFLTSWATRKEIVHVYISVWNNTGQVAYRRREIFISRIHKQGGICRHHCKTIWLKWISSRASSLKLVMKRQYSHLGKEVSSRSLRGTWQMSVKLFLAEYTPQNVGESSFCQVI